MVYQGNGSNSTVVRLFPLSSDQTNCDLLNTAVLFHCDVCLLLWPSVERWAGRRFLPQFLSSSLLRSCRPLHCTLGLYSETQITHPSPAKIQADLKKLNELKYIGHAGAELSQATAP